MKKFVKYAIALAATALLAFLMILIWKGNSRDHSLRTCEGLSVEFGEEHNFVTRDDIKAYLDEEYGAYIGQRVDSVDLHKVEAILDRRSAVLKSEAWITPDNIMHVKISQREPVVRFQTATDGFYADEKGFLFPLQENFTSLVPIVDGNVPIQEKNGFKGQPDKPEERLWLSQVIEMVNYMEKSGIWADNISQITVDGKGDLVLIPREGSEKFIFGSPDQAQDKFRRIEEYYRSIAPLKEKGYYTSVNVKYARQVICRR